MSRWRPTATHPVRTVIEDYCTPQTCRRCGKALLEGMDAQHCGFASGGMYSCVTCPFWAEGERR